MRDQPDLATGQPDDAPLTGGADAPLDGLQAVFASQRAALLRFLAARTGNADLAQDLVQDLWLRIAHKAPAHPASGPIANPRAYLFAAANHLALDHARGTLRRTLRDGQWQAETDGALHPPDLRPDPAPPADEALIAAQEAALLARAIAQLPSGAARALTLHRIEGLSHSEVAAEMGISRSGVEKHMAVAMKHLRAALTNCGDGPAAASSLADTPKTNPLAGGDDGR